MNTIAAYIYSLSIWSPGLPIKQGSPDPKSLFRFSPTQPQSPTLARTFHFFHQFSRNCHLKSRIYYFPPKQTLTCRPNSHALATDLALPTALSPLHVVVRPWPLPHRLVAVGSSTWDTATPDASTSTTELTAPLHGTVHGGAMAVHRLQPSPSGLQFSTVRSPVVLHGPRLTGARTGIHPLLLYSQRSSSCTSCAASRLALLRREVLMLDASPDASGCFCLK
jgi:hypothetical protein